MVYFVRIVALTLVWGFGIPAGIAKDLPGNEGARRLQEAGISLGDALPDLTVHDAQGLPFPLQNLYGKYAVIVFGCMTCPVFLARASGYEAVFRDYSPKGVRFYFVYKSLAHPEYGEGFVAPVTIEERLQHISEAKIKLRTTIPWLADSMSNKFSRHLGGGPNLELIVDPKGKIVAMRDWANPRLMRADLEQLVGKAKTLTTVAQLGLPEYVPVEDPRRGVLPRLKVPGALVPIQTKTEFSKQPFYAKLRAEAGKGLLKTGNGQLYLGLHIDPIYKVHWNNVAPPVEITIQHKKTTQVRPSRYKFPKLEVKADVDPRELMVKVKGFSKGKPLKVKATYYPCDDKNTWCKKISQSYKIFPKAAKAGGEVFTRGSAAKPRQYTTPDWETFWTLDQNGDGIVAREEVKTDGQIRMFNKIDLDFDGRASRDEASRYNKELERQKRPRSTQRHR